jgi:tRNA pseudouridine55 synthase
MVDLATLEARAEEDRGALAAALLPPDEALTSMDAVEVDATEGEKFSGGQALRVANESKIGLVRVYQAGHRFLGVGELSGDGMLAPRRVFQLQEKTP